MRPPVMSFSIDPLRIIAFTVNLLHAFDMEGLVFNLGKNHGYSVGFLAAPVIRRKFICGFILGLGVSEERTILFEDLE